MKRLLLLACLLAGVVTAQPATMATGPCRMDGVGCPTQVPVQTGHSGKYLYTNGLTASWEAVVAGVSGSGASGRLALWSGAGTLTSDAGLTYVGGVFRVASAGGAGAGTIYLGTGGTGSTAAISGGGGAWGDGVVLSGTGTVTYSSSFAATMWFGAIASGSTLGSVVAPAYFGAASGVPLRWTSDTSAMSSADASISRIAPGVVGVGTGAAGSVAGTIAAVGLHGARTKTVTDATPTAFASFTIADGAMYSGEILYSCKSVKGTALQIASGRIRFAATREGSTYTTQVNTVGTELVAAAAGTLACTMTIAGAAGVVTLSASCDTDQASPDSMTLRYQFDALDSAIATSGL